MKAFARIVALTFALALLFGSRSAQAHDADVATFEVRELEIGWTLWVHLPTAAVDRTLRATREDYDQLDRVGYERALVDYLRAHVDIEAGTQILRLGTGGVRLGPHQVDLAFELDGAEAPIDDLHVRIDAFAGPHQVNALRVRPHHGDHLRYMLREDNDYRASWPEDPGVVLDAPHAHEHEHEYEHDPASVEAPVAVEPPVSVAEPQPDERLRWLVRAVVLASLLGFGFGLIRFMRR